MPTGKSFTTLVAVGVIITSCASNEDLKDSPAEGRGPDGGPGQARPGEGPSPPAKPTPEQVAAGARGYATVFCEKAASCAPWYIPRTYGTIAACIARNLTEQAATVTATDSSRSLAMLESCASSRAAQACEDFGSVLPEACRVAPGPRPAGAPCSFGDQCQGRACERTPQSPCGLCAERKGPNGACVNDTTCEEELTCAKGICVPIGGTGAACDLAHPCRFRLTCTSGKCELIQPGAACEASKRDCGFGLTCLDKANSKTCEITKYVSAGEKCGWVNQNYTEYQDCLAAYCTLNPWFGTCPSISEDGASCDASRVCLVPAVCEQGLCQLPDRTRCK